MSSASNNITPGVPAGAVFDFAGAVAPFGYFLCDGSLKSRVDYKRLFEAIGTTYGAGDGSTTFRLPDARGKSSIGAGAGAGLTARTLGESGGEEFHELNEAELPSHTHIQDPHLHDALPHIHNMTTSTSSVPGGSETYTWNKTDVSPGVPTGFGYTEEAFVGIDFKTAINQNTGGGDPHNNMQPFIVFNKIIKY